MATISCADLRRLSETQTYPALLALLGSRGTGALDEDVDVALALSAVLEDPINKEAGQDRVRHLVETGELTAANTLEAISSLRDGTTPFTRERATWESRIDTQLRTVLGRALLLRDVKEARHLCDEAQRLAVDRYLRVHRPGRLSDALDTVSGRLQAALDAASETVRMALDRLRLVVPPGEHSDLALAVKRAEELSRQQESLPAAFAVLQIAQRALEGHLTSEDLLEIHRVGGVLGRVVRTRDQFPPHLRSAGEIAAAVRSGSSGMQAVSDFSDDKTAAFFRDLMPSATRKIDTKSVIKGFFALMGADAPIAEVQIRSLGSLCPLVFPAPRIPAFSGKSRHFAGGTLLVVPINPSDDASITKLLQQQTPDNALRIVYYPGRLDHHTRLTTGASSDVAFIDNVDLMRIAERPQTERWHALQQVILPRLSIKRLKPYQGGGPVAPEMFRGRQDKLERLRQPRGGTVLFSGRMMGKSSILARLHAETPPHRGQVKTYSVLVSSSSEDLLSPLIEKLACLLPSEGKTVVDTDRRLQDTALAKPKTRSEIVQRRLTNFASLVHRITQNDARLTILIDEADKFAEHDARVPREQSLAWKLRDLEFEKPEQIRVVFAGFQRIHHRVLFDNGAFANWFPLVDLPALPREDARSLVLEPLADFGFVFASEAGVDRLLEFTGRHPLLLQEASGRLLDRMASRRTAAAQDEDHVIFIQAGDVESVCRDENLRERVRQVLSLNLDEYPRLKLMVYLLLFASNSPSQGRVVSLDGFSIEDLRALLVDFYEARFNEHFAERSISALVSELMALGLVARQGELYTFVNRTFADMLRNDRGFDAELQRLLDIVTNPQAHEVRRFATIRNEDFERLVRESKEHRLVGGLPNTLQTKIASESRPPGFFLVSAAGASTLEQLLERVRAGIKETRKGLGLDAVLVKNSVTTLLIDSADELATTGALEGVLHLLGSRGIRVVAFGSVGLVRAYVRRLVALDVDFVPLKRLDPLDVKEWAGVGLAHDDFQLIIDNNTAGALCSATGGYFPLIHPFADFVRRKNPTAREHMPDRQTADQFVREHLTKERVAPLLWDILSPEERSLLGSLWAVMKQMNEGKARCVTEVSFALNLIAGEQEGRTGDLRDMYDCLEVLHLLDLVTVRQTPSGEELELDFDGPLKYLLG